MDGYESDEAFYHSLDENAAITMTYDMYSTCR